MTRPEQIVALARGWIGTPYQHQASLRHVGCDCLGLLRGVWRDLYGPEPFVPPVYSADWSESIRQETLAQAARDHLIEIALTDIGAGDVLLFRWRDNLPAKHCGILTGAMTMVHAHDGACVSEVSIGPWWQRHRAYAFRFPENPSIESD
jgi:NlpC/P60 family putative phage cell wall peptidase